MNGEPQRNELGEEGEEGEDGRQRQIAAFNRLPWGAAEGDREREKTHMEGEGRRGDREKETRIVARRWWGGGGKKLAAWLGEGDWNVHSLFRKKGLGWRKWSPDGGRRSYCTHIYRSKKHMHPPHPPPSTSSSMHFIYNNVFLQGIHLSALFSSHFCHIFFIRFSSAGPFFFFFFHRFFHRPPWTQRRAFTE